MERAENINSQILVWARKSAGLSLEDAADRLGFASKGKLTAAEKLERMENGEAFPTRAQLLKIAQVYRRPLITFYLNEPPRKGARGEDFRTLSQPVSPRENALLDALLRDVRARQEMVKSILEDEEEARPLAFVGSASMQGGINAVVKDMSRTLGFVNGERARPGRNGTAEEYFKELRA